MEWPLFTCSSLTRLLWRLPAKKVVRQSEKHHLTVPVWILSVRISAGHGHSPSISFSFVLFPTLHTARRRVASLSRHYPLLCPATLVPLAAGSQISPVSHVKLPAFLSSPKVPSTNVLLVGSCRSNHLPTKSITTFFHSTIASIYQRETFLALL